MAALMVETDTLGVKHRNFNKSVNEAIKSNTTRDVPTINYEESDLDNLFKIDVACKSRNVEYVLEVLKCGDMLYVYRAIKGSTWLIIDQQYLYIINPEYMYNKLYPQMSSKAFNKLILHVRLNLKDEKRVEDFFNYYREKDFQKALKWLPGCSITFIENIVREHADDIPESILKRLYKISVNFLAIFIKNSKSYCKREKISPAMIHLKRNAEKFIDITETSDVDDVPSFGPKYTKRVMETKSEMVMNNLEKYVNKLDIATFAKFVRKEDARDFILTNIKNKEMRLWFNHTNIKYFLNRLPVEERFDFIKKYFIEKSIEDGNPYDTCVLHCFPPPEEDMSSSNNIYCWYEYVPFNKAFEDLKQMIQCRTNPVEKMYILLLLLKCAGRDIKDVLALLKYYVEQHINEPFEFKIEFVNHLLTQTDTYKFDEEAWGYVNDLFSSMEVYIESDKNVQSCVKTIILHNLINGKDIPEIIEQKFEFENLDYQGKFNTDEREIIFNFLYKFLISKINDTNINTINKFDETLIVIYKVLNLVKHYNKDLKDYPYIVQKIKDLVLMRKENSWDRDLSDIYNIKRSWRKLLFTESILLRPTEDSCISALKHDLQLLQIYEDEIKKLCINDNIRFTRFLCKVRTYFPQSLAKSLEKLFLENVDQRDNNGAIIKGLCILLSQKEFINFVHVYAPTEPKIDWSQPDDLDLCLRKNIAKYLHLARPQSPLCVALEYARGDYLQYLQPSLNAILCNVSGTHIRENLTELLHVPVSFQKQIIRVAFSKLNHEELKILFSDIWKSSTSIRNYYFCQTFEILCKEIKESVILGIWELLGIIIDKLTFNENKMVYITLTKADKVPLSVRTAFWMKSYEFLKKLPARANPRSLIENLWDFWHTYEIYEFLEIDFMKKIYFENLVESFRTQQYKYSRSIAMYMLSARTETVQMARYKQILLPLIEQAHLTWDVQHDHIYYTRSNLRDIFHDMSVLFVDVVLGKEMILPVTMYTEAFNKLQSILSVKENYFLLTHIRLSLGYIKILHELKTKVGCKYDFKELYLAAGPIYGQLCLDYLKEDVVKHSPYVYSIFADIFKDVLKNMVDRCDRSYKMNVLRVLKVFVDDKNFVQGQLLALEAMPEYLHENEDKALRVELMNDICSHPSDEVAMYCRMYQED